jgi:FlaA1/EpsC-like NDP-sugar epimerase
LATACIGFGDRASNLHFRSNGKESVSRQEACSLIGSSKDRLPNWLLNIRIHLLVVFHCALFALAYFSVYCLKYELLLSAEHLAQFAATVPVVVVVHLASFWGFNTFHGWWRYVTFRDLLSFVNPMATAFLVLAVAGIFYEPVRIPFSILFLNLLVTGVLLAGSRSIWRVSRELPWLIQDGSTQVEKGRAFIISNHHDTLVLANQINSQQHSSTRIVGILTDQRYPRGTVRAGIPILGRPSDAPNLMDQWGVDQVWLVAGSIPGPELLELKTKYDRAGLATQVIPAATDRSPTGSFIPVREIEINDLLQRERVELDTEMIRDQLSGQCVMVTGAGGSIGSEICRQVLKFQPRQLILLDHRENSVFLINNELLATDTPRTELVPMVGDILDLERMQSVFDTYRPSIVYHAAAHKHVGLMELNPGQAVQNNILGTKQLADLADRFQVSKFVLVSTDKAVNPTSVMGCTKQIAERYVLSLGSRSKTKYVAVRFGNVLGSAGSVVPIFKEQISRGGPITITDPEMTRYFMTIPEASQLVIQSACMGKGGEIFVLDMGEPVKIVDLAIKMIQLAGLPPSAIQIKFTGARPGEKLFEELYFKEETMLPTPHQKVFAAKHRTLDYLTVVADIDRLADMIHATPVEVRAALQGVVPEYEPTYGSREPRPEVATAAAVAE